MADYPSMRRMFKPAFPRKVNNKWRAKTCPFLLFRAHFEQMHRPVTSLLASLLLIFPLAVFAQTPPEDDSPSKIRVSLLPGTPDVDAATQAVLTDWLTQFQRTIYRMKIRDYLQMVDWDALIEATYAGSAVQPDLSKKLLLKKAMILTSERMFPVMRPFFLFLDAEIRRIDVDGDKAVIIARTHDEGGSEFKLRWWLQRHGSHWQMTDYENITVSTRFSALLLMGFQAASSPEGLSKEQASKFIQMGIAMQDGEIDKAYTLVKELDASKLPAVLTEVFLAAKLGVLSQMDGKKDELETALRDLEKIAPTNPVLFLMRTATSYDASDYKNTILWAKKIGASVGHDEDTWSMLADSYRELKEDKEYLAASEGWVADYPNSPTALWNFWQALPEAQREGRIKPLLEKITPAEDGLVEFADNAMIEDDAAAMKMTISVMQARKLAPETVDEFQSSLKMILDAQKSTPEKRK
ncbi:hypothetical protein [Prosthecobacter fluviatilis]|uniref:DUF4440 domain-containing protein n=1 Tax=Prosthecobacter fluviatilis TaxID=445931 RepID=A0ABW0KX17_9BACT